MPKLTTLLRRRGWRHAGSVLAAVSALGLSSGQLSSQTAGQLTEGSYAPPAQALRGSLVFSGAPGLKAPPGADKLSIQLSGLSVEGGLAGTEAALSRLRARLTGKRIAVSEIFAAAGQFETDLATAGYVLARVVIPAQTLVDGGNLKLTVIDGFIEAIDAAAVPAPLRARIERLTNPLIERQGLTLAQLERSLLLAGDTYGVALGSALSTGQRPGGTVIILNPQFRRVTGFVGFDNTLSKDLGRLNFSSGVELNGYLGMGDVFYLRASGHPAFGSDGYFSGSPTIRTLAAGGVVPVGTSGLTFSLEVADSRTRNDTGAVTTSSAFTRYTARLTYPWIRSTKRNVTFGLALDAQEDKQDLVGIAEFYHERSRVLRFSVDSQWQLSTGGNLVIGANFSHGLDALGAGSLAEAETLLPWSRDGAEAEFNKLEVNVAFSKALAENWGILVQGRAQTSFGKPMLSNEQFGIAATDALSPLSQGAVSGDSGWVLRAEASRSFAANVGGLPLVTSPYVFASVGEVFLARPTADEFRRQGATAFGLGVDLTMIRDPRFSSASLRAEYGKAQLDEGGSSSERLTLVGSFRF